MMDVKHFQKLIIHPILFSCELKFMFSCWAVSTKPIAIKYVKKYESFEETFLMSVKENFMICSTLGDMSYLSYLKNKNSRS